MCRRRRVRQARRPWPWSGRLPRGSPASPSRWPTAGPPARPPMEPAPATWSWSRSTRWPSTAGWTSGRPSRPPRSGPGCRTTWWTWSTPTRSSPSSSSSSAARRALAGIAGRGHTALLVGGTGLYLRSVVDDLSFPGRFPEVASGAVRADRPGRPGRESGAAGRPGPAPPPPGGARPGGRRPDRPGQPPAPGARPRGDAGFGPSLLRVRAGPGAVPPEPGGHGRHRPGDRRPGPTHRRAVRPPDGPGAAGGGPRAGRASRGDLAHRPAGPRATASSSPTSRRGCRWRRRWTWPSGAHGPSPGGSGPGSGGIPVSCGWTRPAIPSVPSWP